MLSIAHNVLVIDVEHWNGGVEEAWGIVGNQGLSIHISKEENHLEGGSPGLLLGLILLVLNVVLEGLAPEAEVVVFGGVIGGVQV